MYKKHFTNRQKRVLALQKFGDRRFLHFTEYITILQKHPD